MRPFTAAIHSVGSRSYFMKQERFSLVRPLIKMLFSAVFVVGAGSLAFAQEQTIKSFTSPQMAVNALIEAARTDDVSSIVTLFGEGAEEWVRSGDEVQDEQGRNEFVAAFEKKNGLEFDGDDSATLVVGDDDFPFAIPIVKTSEGWVFDAEAGKEELLNRRIGRNELNTIQALLAIADAQFDYAQEDRDGDGLREYATKFRSSEEKRDGLYWPTEDGEPASPLGELVAEASAEGYRGEKDVETDDDGSGAYHGYRFKLVQRQGNNASGGAFDYVAAGSQIGGFAVIAHPVKYGVSGIMTLQVNHDGVIYEADLGDETEAIVATMEEFNPGDEWGEVDPFDWQLAKDATTEQ